MEQSYRLADDQWVLNFSSIPEQVSLTGGGRDEVDN